MTWKVVMPLDKVHRFIYLHLPISKKRDRQTPKLVTVSPKPIHLIQTTAHCRTLYDYITQINALDCIVQFSSLVYTASASFATSIASFVSARFLVRVNIVSSSFSSASLAATSAAFASWAALAAR